MLKWIFYSKLRFLKMFSRFLCRWLAWWEPLTCSSFSPGCGWAPLFAVILDKGHRDSISSLLIQPSTHRNTITTIFYYQLQQEATPCYFWLPYCNSLYRSVPFHPSPGIAWRGDPWMLEPCQLLPESAGPSTRLGIAKLLDQYGWVEVWMKEVGLDHPVRFPSISTLEKHVCGRHWICIPDATEGNVKRGDCFVLLIICALFF